MEKISCYKCGKEHLKKTSNCCWINCDCEEEICGNCGSGNISSIPESDLDLSGEDQYWCCRECSDCGLRGCAMCI